MIMLCIGDGKHDRPTAPTTEVVNLTVPSVEMDIDLVGCLRRVSFEKTSFLSFCHFSTSDSYCCACTCLVRRLSSKKDGGSFVDEENCGA
jgi:hypothetical protein